MKLKSLLYASVLAATCTQALLADATIIKGGTLVQTAPELTRIANSYIIIDDDQIVEVGQGKLPKAHPNATVIDAKGKFIIPGLIDSHVHLGSRPGIPFRHTPEYLELLNSYYTQSVKSYLYYGYTSVIDLNVGNREHLAKFKKSPVTPNIYDCDAAAPVAEGYPLRFYPKAIRYTANRNFIFNDDQRDLIPSTIDPAEHTPEAVVARAKSNGAVCFKAFYEKGWKKGAEWPVPDNTLLTQLQEETEKAGLPLLIHANREANQKATYEYADILVHGMWHWDDIDGKPAIEPGKSAFELAEKIAKSGTAYMPTFQVLPGEGALFDHRMLNDPELENAFPKKLIDWYKTPEARWYRNDILGEESPDPAVLKRRYKQNTNKTKQSYKIAKHIYDNGGSLLFGSDTPSDQTYGNPPGLNGYWEMRHWHAAGIPLESILRSATWDNARAFGIVGEVGTIGKGKLADILILERDPTKSLEAYNSIETVISRGEILERPSLSAKNN